MHLHHLINSPIKIHKMGYQTFCMTYRAKIFGPAGGMSTLYIIECNIQH